ncbi:MAG: hypothetical protein K2M17_06155 [Bacilli bacterium]|nr:hypothetical protein [Bacilli bacterium]
MERDRYQIQIEKFTPIFNAFMTKWVVSNGKISKLEKEKELLERKEYALKRKVAHYQRDMDVVRNTPIISTMMVRDEQFCIPDTKAGVVGCGVLYALSQVAAKVKATQPKLKDLRGQNVKDVIKSKAKKVVKTFGYSYGDYIYAYNHIHRIGKRCTVDVLEANFDSLKVELGECQRNLKNIRSKLSKERAEHKKVYEGLCQAKAILAKIVTARNAAVDQILSAGLNSQVVSVSHMFSEKFNNDSSQGVLPEWDRILEARAFNTPKRKKPVADSTDVRLDYVLPHLRTELEVQKALEDDERPLIPMPDPNVLTGDRAVGANIWGNCALAEECLPQPELVVIEDEQYQRVIPFDALAQEEKVVKARQK